MTTFFSLLTLPCLVTGIVLSISDIKARTVPRIVVIIGYLSQLAIFLAYALEFSHLRSMAVSPAASESGKAGSPAVQSSLAQLARQVPAPWPQVGTAVAISAICALLMYGMSKIKPGALGLGDASATFVLTLSVGWFSWMAMLYWWIAVGLIGLIYLGVMKARKAPTSVAFPFVPVLTAATVVVILLRAFGL